MKFKFGKKASGKTPAAQPTEAQRASRRRMLHSGAYASALAAVVLAVVILLNLVIRAVPTKYTEFDISTGQMFTLSETTVSMMKSLDQDVTAYFLAETGNEDTNITRILDRYAGESSHFTWQQRDPALYPTFADQYDAGDASSNSVILVCGDKSTVVDYTDMYEYSYTDYYSYDMKFAAESALTTAIAQVTRENSYIMYALTGHGESSLGSDFTETLSNAGVTVNDLNLNTGEIPEDADALIINVPQADFSELDADALRGYLSDGGKIIVATSLLFDTPNLDAVLAEYGMVRQDGLLVESDPNYYAYRYAGTYLLPIIQSNEITSGINSGMFVFAPSSQGIVTVEEEATAQTDETAESESALTHTSLLTTSSTAYSMLDYETATVLEQGENDPTGSFDLAVAAEDESTGAKLVWINCGNIFLDEINAAVSGGNAQLLGSITNWMNGEENGAVIDGKSMSAESLTVPSSAVAPLGILFVFVIPLCVLLAGVVVTILRRRR